MSILITDTSMTSPHTVHTATLADAASGLWSVSWLPGITLDRKQAITAMTLAEVERDATPFERIWPSVVGWANELGLSVSWALQKIRGQAHG